MEEPTYLPVDENGIPVEENTVKRFTPAELHLKFQGLLEEALALTGRNYVQPHEVADWRRIDRMLANDDLEVDWIREKLNWAKTERNGRHFVSFRMLYRAILNGELYEDWLRKRNAGPIRKS